jgi:hypothetical protein
MTPYLKFLAAFLVWSGLSSPRTTQAQANDNRDWASHLKPSVNSELTNLSDNTWKLLKPTGDRFTHPKTEVGLVYDEGTGCVIYFGGCSSGYTNNLWLYHVGSNTWREVLPWTKKKEEESDCPIGQCGYYAIYNSDLKVYFKHRGGSSTGLGRGGSGRDSNSWILDTTKLKWEKAATGEHYGTTAEWPGAYCCYAMAYDRDAKEAIMYGGLGEGETWAFDFSKKKWRNLKPSASPPPLSMPSMVYDTKHKVTLLFGGQTGGYSNGTSTNETWAYDHSKNAWEKLNAPNPPARRLQAQACYDSINGVMIVFGGHASVYPKRDEGERYDDTWVFDYSKKTWTEMTPAERPKRSDVRFMAFDPVNNVAINVSGGVKKETWAYRYKVAK